VRALHIAEHEAIKKVALSREFVEKGGGVARVGRRLVEDGAGVRDDARSVSTVVPHELDTVEEEEKEQCVENID